MTQIRKATEKEKALLNAVEREVNALWDDNCGTACKEWDELRTALNVDGELDIEAGYLVAY